MVKYVKTMELLLGLQDNLVDVNAHGGIVEIIVKLQIFVFMGMEETNAKMEAIQQELMETANAFVKLDLEAAIVSFLCSALQIQFTVLFV